MDPYKILGVERSNTCKEIERIAKKKMMDLHPDKGGNSDDFVIFLRAYQILSDPEKRQRYDETGIFDDKKEPTPEDAAILNLMQLFGATLDTALQNDQFDPSRLCIFSLIKDNLKNQAIQINTMINGFNKQLSKINTFLSKLDTDQQFVLDIVKHKEIELSQQLIKVKKALEINAMMLDLLKNSKTKDLITNSYSINFNNFGGTTSTSTF